MAKKKAFILFVLLLLLVPTIVNAQSTCEAAGGQFCTKEQSCDGEINLEHSDFDSNRVCCIGACEEVVVKCPLFSIFDPVSFITCQLSKLTGKLSSKIYTFMSGMFSKFMIGLPYIGERGVYRETASGERDYFIYKYCVAFVYAILVGFVIYNGYQWMFAGADPMKVEMAKQQLINFIWMALVIYFVPYFIIPILQGIEIVTSQVMALGSYQFMKAAISAAIYIIGLGVLFFYTIAALPAAFLYVGGSLLYFVFALVTRVVLVGFFLSTLPLWIAAYFFIPFRKYGKAGLSLLGINLIFPMLWAFIFAIAGAIFGPLPFLGPLVILLTFPIAAHLYFKFAGSVLSGSLALPGGISTGMKRAFGTPYEETKEFGKEEHGYAGMAGRGIKRFFTRKPKAVEETPTGATRISAERQIRHERRRPIEASPAAYQKATTEYPQVETTAPTTVGAVHVPRGEMAEREKVREERGKEVTKVLKKEEPKLSWKYHQARSKMGTDETIEYYEHSAKTAEKKEHTNKFRKMVGTFKKYIDPSVDDKERHSAMWGIKKFHSEIPKEVHEKSLKDYKNMKKKEGRGKK